MKKQLLLIALIFAALTPGMAQLNTYTGSAQTYIDANITSNGANQITGAKLNQALNRILLGIKYIDTNKGGYVNSNRFSDSTAALRAYITAVAAGQGGGSDGNNYLGQPTWNSSLNRLTFPRIGLSSVSVDLTGIQGSGGSSGTGAGSRAYTITSGQISNAGKTLTLPIFDSGLVTGFMIDDAAKNTGFNKTTLGPKTFTDASVWTAGQEVTVYLSHAPPVAQQQQSSYVSYNDDNLFDVRAYGAKMDVKVVYDASIAANSNTLVSITAFFTGSDIGKKIKVPWAAANHNDTVFTITAVNSGTSVTLSGNTSFTGGSTVYWGSDDTGPVQAAVNACAAVGGGRIQVIRPTLIAGPVLGTVNGITYNAQIYVPFHDYRFDDNTRATIEFYGGYRAPGTADNGPGTYGLTRPSMGFGGFVSFGTSSDSSAAVIATAGPFATNYFSYNDIVFKNFKIIVTTNGDGGGAGLGGANMGWAVRLKCDQVIVNIDDNLMNSAFPSYHHRGINGPNTYSDAMSTYDETIIYGQYVSLAVSEHTDIRMIGGYGCYYGLEFKESAFQINADIVTFHWCTRGYLVTGPAQVKVNATNIEAGIYTSTKTGNPTWYSVNMTGLLDDWGQSKRGNPYIRGQIIANTSLTSSAVLPSAGFELIGILNTDQY